MRNRISAAVMLLGTLLPIAAAAKMPSVAALDAAGRAQGNRPAVALAVGEALFKSEWPVQIFRVSADGIGNHVVLGLGLYGVKFHRAVSRQDFCAEIAALVTRAFDAAPQAEEIDVWTVVPIAVAKGVVVSGDLAKPTTQTVFAVSIPRSALPTLSASRLPTYSGAFWDQEWVRTAFNEVH